MKNESSRPLQTFPLSMLTLLLVAAFFPINLQVYALQGILPFLLLMLWAFGLLKSVKVNRSWALALGALYAFEFLRMLLAILLERNPGLWVNYATWIFSSSGLALFLLEPLADRPKYERIRRFVKGVILVEGVIGIAQLVVFSQGGMGAGDVVTGTLRTQNSHLFGMMIITLGLGIFLSAPPTAERRRSDTAAAGFAGLVFVLSSFLLGLVYTVFFSLFSVLFFLRKHRLKIVIAASLLVGFFAYTQRENAAFVWKYLNQVRDLSVPEYAMPRKLQAVLATKDLYAKDPWLLFAGFGAGLYNSRAAMILTNAYIAGDLGFESMSHATQKYISPLWNIHSVNFIDSVLNQPWFSLFSFFAEHGIIVFLAVAAFIVRALRKEGDRRTTLMACYVLGSLFLDNLLEFPQFVFVSYVALWLVRNRPRDPEAAW